jgi:hypothetical protein
MRTKNSLAKWAVTSVAVVGALSVAMVGLAGQAGATTPTTAAVSNGALRAQAHRNLVCSNAEKRRGGRRESAAAFSKRVTALTALEAKAQAAGHTKRAAYLAKVIAHDQTVASRLGAHLTKREAKEAAIIARRCAART